VCRASPAQQEDDEFDELVDLDRVGMRLSDDRHTQPVPSTFGLVVKTGWNSHSMIARRSIYHRAPLQLHVHAVLTFCQGGCGLIRPWGMSVTQKEILCR
jgi:hypothetical protein